MFNISEQEKKKFARSRKIVDFSYNTLTFISSLVGIVVFFGIIAYVLIKGSGLLSWGLITGDYYSSIQSTVIQDVELEYIERPESLGDDVYFSNNWGIGVIDTKNKEGEKIVVVTYIDELSPMLDMIDKASGERLTLEVDQAIMKIFFDDGSFVIRSYGAEYMIQALDNATGISEFTYESFGGGIRGSIVTTLYLIILTLLISLPIGVFTAIYLNEYAGKGRVTAILKSLIEMLTGVPSIIFGLMGAVVFIPMTKAIGADGGNIVSGSLTMAIILLPVIIRSTEEALKVIPNDLRSASLALGANKTQTTFKVVIPSALNGILAATLLGIGRVIGESAALIYAIGTTIKDEVILTEKSTTLAVHIWKVMSGEVPNFELASAIVIIILITVLGLNLLVKLISRRFNKLMS